MSRAQMIQRLGADRIQDERPARLDKHELTFSKEVRGGSGSANIQNSPGNTVYGVLYRLPESALKVLDRFEGVPMHYRRIEANVSPLENDGQKVPAAVYIAAKPKRGLKPDRLYLQKLIEGATEHNLPADYVEKLKSYPTK
jgi:gamma-glutamylcyclotransferase (GGCT)/AIG2-like uncharacterized protein YtfP